MPPRVMRCRFKHAYCHVCGKKIEKGQYCVYLGTEYFYRGNRSIRVHFKCLSKLIEMLIQLKEEWEDKVCIEEL